MVSYFGLVRVRKLLVVFVLFFISLYGFGESYFYFEPFNATPTGWWYVATGVDGGLWYGRD